MATLIQFPSGKPVAQRAPVAAKPAPSPTPSAVSPIRKRIRVPKCNRPEDEHTAMIARIAKSYAEKAHALARSEPNSARHRFVDQMAGIAHKLPRNNLRLLTTRDDVLTGVWALWRKVKLACLEWELCDARRMEAHHEDDAAAIEYWSGKNAEAEKQAWLAYERLVHVPAANLTDFKHYKLDRRFGRNIGNIEWMRKWKPELAAILDEEQAQLIAAKDARKARRARKGEA